MNICFLKFWISEAGSSFCQTAEHVLYFKKVFIYMAGISVDYEDDTNADYEEDDDGDKDNEDSREHNRSD